MVASTMLKVADSLFTRAHEIYPVRLLRINAQAKKGMELLQEGSELKPLLQARLDLESCTSSCSDPLKPASQHYK